MEITTFFLSLMMIRIFDTIFRYINLFMENMLYPYIQTHAHKFLMDFECFFFFLEKIYWTHKKSQTNKHTHTQRFGFYHLFSLVTAAWTANKKTIFFYFVLTKIQISNKRERERERRKKSIPFTDIHLIFFSFSFSSKNREKNSMVVYVQFVLANNKLIKILHLN